MSKKKVKIAYVGRNRNIHDARLINSLISKFEIKEFFTANVQFDVIPIEEFFGISLVIAGPLTDAISVLPQSLSVPIVGISHAFDLNIESATYPIEENIMRCSGIICDCLHSVNILEKKYKYKGELFEIPFGCDQEYFSNVNIKYEEWLNILVTRNWYEVYRNDLIIEALKILKDKGIGFKCTFLGEGPLLPTEVANKVQVDIDCNVDFKGGQSPSKVREEMSHNWLYISAASSDGSSVSLLEAMAAGMVCIVSDFPSNLEWIDNAVNGFVFRNGDPRDMARVIQTVFSLKTADKIRIGNRARLLISTKGDWESNQNRFVSAISDFIV